MQPKIIQTNDGSHSIYLSEMDEHYHSVHGAMQESQHVFVETGFNYLKSPNIQLFEVGFGTGLNAILTYCAAKKQNKAVKYYTIEKYPLDASITNQLNYTKLIPDEYATVFHKLHNAPWNQEITIDSNFTLHKIQADFIVYNNYDENSFDLIYYDAFAPNKQSKMWNEKLLYKCYAMLKTSGVLTTYTVKGDVKKWLKKIGFHIERLPGPIGKRHILRAIKNV